MPVEGNSEMRASMSHGVGRGGWLLVVCLGAAVTGAGCTGCSSTSPQPVPEPSLPLLTVPDSALYSLVAGIEHKSSQLYRHAIAETTLTTDADFHAVFDPQDTLDYLLATGARPPQDWTSRDERAFFPYFASLRPAPYDTYFTEDPARPDQRGPQVTIFYRRYRIWAGGGPLAVGRADLTLKRVGVNRQWKVVYWVDHRDTSTAAVRSYGRRRLDSLSP